MTTGGRKIGPYDMIWIWNPNGFRILDRKGQHCRVVVRGKKNSALLEFEDGFRVVASRNGIRKAAFAKKAEQLDTRADLMLPWVQARSDIGDAIKEEPRQPEPCEDCIKARRHAYSDVTTPGFFRPCCLEHDLERSELKTNPKINGEKPSNTSTGPGSASKKLENSS